MTRYLLAVDAVHGAAAACDYLETRIEPDDALFVVSFGDGRGRDEGDATNVLRVRLPVERIETVQSDGDGAEPVLRSAEERDADVVVLSHHGTESDRSVDGSIRDRVLDGAERPVVVIPSA